MRGFDKAKMTFLHAQAQVREMEVGEAEIRAAINHAIEKANAATKEITKVETAAVSPVGPNQHPRMLQVSAWIAHAGGPNRNDRAFTKDDLQEAVANGLFKAPYFGMIDYNHDFEAYGAWYEAEFAFDPQAGEWGILAHGALFAWRYEELADKVLAMQARNGHVDVSMACLADSYEQAETEDGRPYLVVRRPVFFTTSLLDVPPADANARAVGTESVDETNDQRREALMTANLEEATTTEEVSMDEDTVTVETAEETVETPVEETVETPVEETVETAAGDLPAEDAPLVEDSAEETEEAPVVETAEEAPATEETVEEPVVEAAAANLEEQVATLETARQTAEAALNAARVEMAELETELAALRAFKDGIDAERLAAEEAAKREARMNQIPASVLAALGEEKDTMVEKWMNQSDDHFADTLTLFNLASTTRKSFVERSAEEGTLPASADKTEGGAEWVIRRWRNRK